jgi:hypothetical protein
MLMLAVIFGIKLKCILQIRPQPFARRASRLLKPVLIPIMTIDPVLVLAPIFLTTELLSLALCLALASLRRSGLPGVSQWLLANIAVVVYLPLLGLRGVVPDSISIVAANGILALSVACTMPAVPIFWASRHAGTGCWAVRCCRCWR